MTDKTLRELARAAKLPMSEIGLIAHKKAAILAFQDAANQNAILELLDGARRAEELEAQQSETILAQAGKIAELLDSQDRLEALLRRMNAARTLQERADLYDDIENELT